jgi:UDP-glucose 4-epimerase
MDRAAVRSPLRFLVTGGGGFLGVPLCQKLRELGAEVFCLDRRSGLDITDWNQVCRVERCDVLFHLAASVGVDIAENQPRETHTTNVLGTVNMLEYCRTRKVKRLVFASSYVYGPPAYLPVDEEHPINADNPYAMSKVIGEDLCRQYHENYGLSIVVLRIFNPYGPRQPGNFLIPTILSQIQRQGGVILRDPTPRRDFVFVEDVVNAFATAGLYTRPGFGIFNVASGKSYSVTEVVGKIQGIFNRPFEVTYTDTRRPFEIADCVGGVKRSKLVLGWEAKVDLDSGLRQTIETWDG